MIKRSDNVNTLKAVHTDISCEDNIIRVVKSEKINEYDENTYARVCDLHFHDGVIEVDMLSRLLPDAPDFARGFIGIAFRINEDDTQFESFYIRPTNSVNKTDDHVRIAHGVSISLILSILLLILEKTILRNMKHLFIMNWISGSILKQ